jgi:hypothetical protein
MSELRDRLEGVLSKLGEIEGAAGGTPGTEKELCQQVRTLAEAVKEILIRFEEIEEKVSPKIPPPMLSDIPYRAGGVR